MLNQIEIHPYCQAVELARFCEENGVKVECYAPFASGQFGLLRDPVLERIASELGKSVGQVVLRWQVQQGRAVIPKSSSEQRMRENSDLFSFSLSPEHMAAIALLQGPGVPAKRSCPDPDTIR